MSETIELTLIDKLEGRAAADAIAPDRFAALSAAEIARLPIWVTRPTASGNAVRHAVPLGDLFTVRGERVADVRIEGDLANVDGLGTGMAGGALMVEGNVGDELGRGMSGGRIEAHGHVGNGAGLAMSGGTMWITGRAGDSVGGAVPGASRGMTGGEILVRGNVGREAGARTRRGLIVVGGDADDGAAQAMIAGTLLVMGTAAGAVGLWNKRGTIVAIGGAAVPPTYRHACTYRAPFLQLMFTYLRRMHRMPISDRLARGRYARYCGDLSELGKGELLVWAEP
jgi:formylmethanofuran dehydrogenase subunit C